MSAPQINPFTTINPEHRHVTALMFFRFTDQSVLKLVTFRKHHIVFKEHIWIHWCRPYKC